MQIPSFVQRHRNDGSRILYLGQGAASAATVGASSGRCCAYCRLSAVVIFFVSHYCLLIINRRRLFRRRERALQADTTISHQGCRHRRRLQRQAVHSPVRLCR